MLHSFITRRCKPVKMRSLFWVAKNLRKMVTISTDDDGIFYIAIDRPERRNAVNMETANQLYDAFNEFNECNKSAVGVFHSCNGNFCAGFDLQELSTFKNITEDDVVEMLQNRGPMGPSRLHLKKPVIAAIAGHAVAGGLELALLCDMRILEEDATVGVFCRRFGVPLIDGGTVRLPKLIGLSRAMDLILTGRPVDATEAQHMGLANRVVPKGKSLEEAKILARQLLRFPQACMLADRESAYHAAFDAGSVESALNFEYRNAIKVIKNESVPGASEFISGKGKQGAFSI